MIKTQQLATLASHALEDAKAVDIQIIDVRKLTDITDFMLICNGTSDRHTRSLARNVQDTLNEKDVKPASTEGEETGEWVLIDYIDIVIHIMKKETREYYDLESLWDVRLAASA